MACNGLFFEEWMDGSPILAQQYDAPCVEPKGGAVASRRHVQKRYAVHAHGGWRIR